MGHPSSVALAAPSAGRTSPDLSRERSGLRVALYSHDSQGLGHVRRNSLLAASLVDADPSIDVLLLSGAPEVSALPLPPRTEVVKVPSLAKDERGCYHARSLRVPLPTLVAMRASVLTGVLTTWAPDVLIVDKTPRGALDELDELLPVLRARGTLTVLGLRDVLDDPETTGREWAASRADEAIKRLYDQVWVYGDPRLFDPAREYAWKKATRRKVVYTGYLGLDRDRLLPVRRREDGTASYVDRDGSAFVLGLVGGGQDGAHVAKAFAGARFPRGHKGLLLTGPYAPPSVVEHVQRAADDRPDLRVIRLAGNVPDLVRRSSATVSMGGYNTACEVMAAGGPVLVVPRTSPRREQALRAERLALHGLADVHPPEALTSELLSDWFAGAVTRPPAPPPLEVDLGGLRRIPLLLRALVDARREEDSRDGITA